MMLNASILVHLVDLVDQYLSALPVPSASPLGASTCVNLNREMEINSPLILYAAVLILLKVIFFLRWYIITLLLMK
jgi:hypothetical protein